MNRRSANLPRYSENGMVVREFVRTDASSRAQWSDWKAERAYSERRYAKYSPLRLFMEALAYSLLLASMRWATRMLFLQTYPDWVNLGSTIMAAVSIGFGAVASFAAFAYVSTEYDLFRGRAGNFTAPPPPAEQTAPGTTRIDKNGDTSGRPPAIPSFVLELIVPRRDRASLIGDLEEGYTQDLLPKYGQSAAAFWYWTRCMREVLFYGWPLLKKGLPWGILIAAASTAKLSWLTEILQRITK
jgi:hypothetical protein